MNPVPGRGSASGHLDPCAQEFTPGPYSLLRAPPPPPPPPPPPLYYSSYPLDGQSYVQPTVSAGSIPVNPVMPMYHTSEVGIPFVSTIPQPWDSRQHQQEAYRLGMQGGEVVTRPGPPCLPFLPRGMTSYGYHGVNFNSAIQNSNGLVSRVSIPYQQSPTPFTMGREHASRTLLLSMVPAELSDSDLRQQLEKWGPVRALQTENRHHGYVTVHYFDLRHAKTALMEIQEQHLAEQKRLQQHYQSLQLRQCRLKDEDEHGNEDENGKEEYDHGQIPPPPPPPPEVSRGLIGGKAIWAQYTIPVGVSLGTEGHNQGTLVVFNLDADIDTNALRSIFEAFGAVKELRETPTKRQHKFVEFFDVRDAARALAEMDGQEIGGKRVKIEFSRPGGQTRRRTSPPPPPQSPYSPLMHVSQPRPCTNANLQLTLFPHQHQQSDYARWSNVGNIDSKWAGQDSERADIGHTSAMNGRGWGGCRGRGGGRCGSAASSNCRGNTNSRNTTSNSRSNNNNNCNGRYKAGIEGFGGGGFVRRRKSNGSHAQVRFEQAIAESDGIGISSKGPSAKNGSNTNHNLNNKSGRFYSEIASHFAFDEAMAESNSNDARTTVMIKNIPNKYSQQMLLSMLDQHCISCNEPITENDNETLSAYDFVYLPIDFKNKCNLGYAFVNMTTSKATWKLYKAFNRQPWEAFNSRKICEVAYARIQGSGRTAQEEHFRNSKFDCETDEYLPLVFDPPRDGVQLTEPVTMGDHITSNKNVVGNSTVQDDRESNAPPPQFNTTTSFEPHSDVKSMNACYRSNNNFHRSHDANNFSHGRRQQQQQQRSMGGAASGGNSVGYA